MSSCNQSGGDWFVEEHFKEQAVRMSVFLKDAAKPGNKLVLLEIGAGFNTPTVIRHRFETITYQRLHNGSPCKLIRLNLQVCLVAVFLPLPIVVLQSLFAVFLYLVVQFILLCHAIVLVHEFLIIAWQYPEIPEEITECSLSLKGRTGETLNGLKKQIGEMSQSTSSPSTTTASV